MGSELLHRRQIQKNYETKIPINKILRDEIEKESFNKKGYKTKQIAINQIINQI
jgi:hypothetical protein